MRKVLFVCTANLQRSPTAEKLFQAWQGVWEAKSAGIIPDPSGNTLTQELIDWADLVIVMETIHSQYIHSHFQSSPDKVRILNIADKYFRDDPELVRELRRKITPILQEYLCVCSQTRRKVRPCRLRLRKHRCSIIQNTKYSNLKWEGTDVPPVAGKRGKDWQVQTTLVTLVIDKNLSGHFTADIVLVAKTILVGVGLKGWGEAGEGLHKP